MKKKIKMLRKAIVWIVVLGGFFSLITFLNQSNLSTEKEEVVWDADAKTEAKEKWELVTENESMELYFDPGRVQIKVVDKKTGTNWNSNPLDAEEDKIAFGQNKSAVRSLIDVTYVDEQGSFYTVNNFMGSVQDGTYTYEYKDHGVYVNFQFDKQDFEIPCFFGIENDRLIARILNDQMKQHGIHRVSSIALLPYFGAGSLEDEGYMVVPDGCGALIRFNNQKQTYQSYMQRVYGKNLAVNQQTSLLCEQNATMPIFGIKKNQDAFLAVITKGEYQAEIRADVSRKISGNNTVYSSVVYIQTENNTLMANSSHEEIATMLSPQDNQFPQYEVSYFFLEKEADYSDMAQRYQTYLLEEKGMKENAQVQKAMNLNFIGGIMKNKTFLGVPYQSVEALSSFAGVNDIVTELGSNSMLVSMTNIANGGTKSKVPTKVTFENALGGKKGYEQLVESLSNNEIPFYPIYNPIHIWKSGNGYSTYQAARNVTQSLAIQYEYSLTTGLKETTKPYSYLVSPPYAPEITKKMGESLLKNEMKTVGLSGIGDSIYADYRKDNISRNESGELFVQALETIEESVDSVLLEGAYSYAFPYADVITQVPVYSSKYDIEDEEIPLYQMVASGYLALYSEPLNMVGNVRDMMLRAVEFGVSPSFLLTEQNENALKNTDYLNYYAVSYENWKDEIQEVAIEIDAMRDLWGKKIINHEVTEDGIRITTYENGEKVYVNYSQQEVVIHDVIVPAKGFTVEGGR